MRNYCDLNGGDGTFNNLRYHHNILKRQKSQPDHYDYENNNNYTYNNIQYDIDSELNNNSIYKKHKKNRRKNNSFNDIEISNPNNCTSNNNLNNKMTFYNDEDEDLDIELEAISQKIPINEYYNNNININDERSNNFKVNTNNINPFMKKKSKIHRNSSSDNLRINNMDNFRNDIIEYTRNSNNNLNNLPIRTQKNNNIYSSSNNYLKNKEIILNNYNKLNNNFIDDYSENRGFRTIYDDKNSESKFHEDFDSDENCLLTYKRNFVNNAKNNINDFSFDEEKYNKPLKEENAILEKYKMENIELRKKNVEYLNKISSLEKLIKNENFLYQKIKKLENELTKKNSQIAKLTYNKRKNVGVKKIRVCSFIISNKTLKNKKRTTSSIPKYNKKIVNFAFPTYFKNLKIINESEISCIKQYNNNKYNESIRENVILNEDQHISNSIINDILNLDKTEFTDNTAMNNNEYNMEDLSEVKISKPPQGFTANITKSNINNIFSSNTKNIINLISPNSTNTISEANNNIENNNNISENNEKKINKKSSSTEKNNYFFDEMDSIYELYDNKKELNTINIDNKKRNIPYNKNKYNENYNANFYKNNFNNSFIDNIKKNSNKTINNNEGDTRTASIEKNKCQPKTSLIMSVLNDNLLGNLNLAVLTDKKTTLTANKNLLKGKNVKK